MTARHTKIIQGDKGVQKNKNKTKQNKNKTETETKTKQYKNKLIN